MAWMGGVGCRCCEEEEGPGGGGVSCLEDGAAVEFVGDEDGT